MGNPNIWNIWKTADPRERDGNLSLNGLKNYTCKVHVLFLALFQFSWGIRYTVTIPMLRFSKQYPDGFHPISAQPYGRYDNNYRGVQARRKSNLVSSGKRSIRASMPTGALFMTIKLSLQSGWRQGNQTSTGAHCIHSKVPVPNMCAHVCLTHVLVLLLFFFSMCVYP